MSFRDFWGISFLIFSSVFTVYITDSQSAKYAGTILKNHSIPVKQITNNNTQHVVARWTFDEGSGDSAYDQSGNGNHFKLLNGVGWVQGLNGTALDFDGIDDMGLCADMPVQTSMNALTIEAVVWADAYPASNEWGPIINKWGPGSTEDDAWGLDISRYTNGLHGVVCGGGTFELNSDSLVPIKKWVHLVFTCGKSECELFINGSKVDSLIYPGIGIMNDSDTEIRLGNNIDSNYFDGKIDEITIYDYALPRDIILEHYNELMDSTVEINFGMQAHYANPGDEIWVPLYITNFEEEYDVSAVKFSLTFNAAIIEYIEASFDSSIAKDWQFAVNDLGDSLFVGMGGITQSIGYSQGELIRFKFKVKSGVTSGSYSDLVIKDIDIDEGSGVIPSTTHGKILVDKIAILYGDVSGNNKVSPFDGAGIVQYVVGNLDLPCDDYPNFTQTVADVSGDTSITSYDAALVFQYSVGMLEKFPVESYGNGQGYGPEQFPDAALRLVKTPENNGNTVYFDLFGENIRGTIAADIVLYYDTTKILAELGGSITTDLFLNIESSLDVVKKYLIISITTTDDFDKNTEMKIATIEVPAVDTSLADGGLLFVSATINEEEIKNLSPTVVTGNITNKQCMVKNRILINNRCGLTVHNGEKVSVTVTLYDIRGRRIYTRRFSATQKVVKVRLNDIASGMYLFRIKMGSRIITRSFLRM